MFETLPTLPDDDKQHRVAVREWWDTVSEVLKDIQNVTDLGDLPYELFDSWLGKPHIWPWVRYPTRLNMWAGKDDLHPAQAKQATFVGQ